MRRTGRPCSTRKRDAGVGQDAGNERIDARRAVDNQAYTVVGSDAESVVTREGRRNASVVADAEIVGVHAEPRCTATPVRMEIRFYPGKRRRRGEGGVVEVGCLNAVARV